MNTHATNLATLIAPMVRSAAPDLTLRTLAILIEAQQTPNHSVKYFAADLCISKPAVTRSVSRLVNLGLVTRAVDPQDRRAVRISVTRRGAAFLAGIGVDGGRKVAA